MGKAERETFGRACETSPLHDAMERVGAKRCRRNVTRLRAGRDRVLTHDSWSPARGSCDLRAKRTTSHESRRSSRSACPWLFSSLLVPTLRQLSK